MILSYKRISMALIGLCGCAGWSASLLFATPEDRFSRDDAHIVSISLTAKHTATIFYIQQPFSLDEDPIR